jgi:hypothetical protein
MSTKKMGSFTRIFRVDSLAKKQANRKVPHFNKEEVMGTKERQGSPNAVVSGTFIKGSEATCSPRLATTLRPFTNQGEHQPECDQPRLGGSAAYLESLCSALARRIGSTVARYVNVNPNAAPPKQARAYPLSIDEQRLLFSELAGHLAKMALFKVNTGLPEHEVVNL